MVDDAQAAGPLGDERAPVGQECDAPGVLEPARDHLELHRRLLRRDDLGLGAAGGRWGRPGHSSEATAQATRTATRRGHGIGREETLGMGIPE